jgi:hypothetical protein
MLPPHLRRDSFLDRMSSLAGSMGRPLPLTHFFWLVREEEPHFTN